MSIIESILAILNMFYEVFKALHKDNLEAFEKEWKEDVDKFVKALKGRASSDPVVVANSNRDLAFLLTKYSNLL